MNIQPPTRAIHSYVQHLVAGPERVFPLLCPVREADWIQGWDPLQVTSASGVAERDCVFVTAAEPDNAIWYITRHEADASFVEMLKIMPGSTACRLAIQLQATTSGCDATVTYMHTSLGTPAGDAFVANFTADFYEQFMHDWEARLNHFLCMAPRCPANAAEAMPAAENKAPARAGAFSSRHSVGDQKVIVQLLM